MYLIVSSYFKDLFTFIIVYWFLLACKCVYHVSVWCSQSPEHGVVSPGIVVTDGWYLPCGCWESNWFPIATSTLNFLFACLQLYNFSPLNGIGYFWPIFLLLASFRCLRDVMHSTISIFFPSGAKKQTFAISSHRWQIRLSWILTY